jgi:hypothetical protein
MSSVVRRITPVALLLCVAGIWSALPALAQENGGQKQDLAVELQSLKNRIENLEKSNQALQSQNRELAQLLAEIKMRLDTEPSGSPSRLAAANADPVDTAGRPVGASLRTTPASGRSRNEVETSGPDVNAAPEPPQVPSGDSVRWRELISGENRLRFYGALRLDMIYDSKRPNNPQSPQFILPNFPFPLSTLLPANENFTMHPRLTTFGIDYTGPVVSSFGDGRLSGKLEIDFQNGGPEFAPAVRILQAYARMDWDGLFVLAGQTWDTFSPLRPTVNDDSVMFTAGNPGLRRPMLIMGYDSRSDAGGFSAIGGVGLTGAIDNADRDFDGVRDGEQSGRPHWQGRVGYSHPLLGQRASIGLSGAYGFLRTRSGAAHERIGNVDFTLPLAGFLSLRGEGYWGKNLSDFGGGPILQLAVTGVTFPGGDEELNGLRQQQVGLPSPFFINNIHGRGGWAELTIKASRYWSAHPGFTTDDPVDGDFPVFAGATNITRNRAFYFANRIYPGNNLTIGVDYLRWKTTFRGLGRGLDNRVNVFFKYSF